MYVEGLTLWVGDALNCKDGRQRSTILGCPSICAYSLWCRTSNL